MSIIQATIDRFEGDRAVLLLADSDQSVVWPREYLPSDAQEGDVLRVEVGIDREATNKARQEAAELLQAILDQNRKG